MSENHQTNRGYHDESWKERVLYASPGVVAALLWAFTALRFQPSIVLLLLLGVLGAGAAIFGQMMLRWGGGRSSSKVTFAACASGALLMITAGVELAFMPEGAPWPVSLPVILLLLVAISYWRRVVAQENAARM
jgi:hypothetical protein